MNQVSLLAALAGVLAVAAATSAQSQERQFVVLELFTSQGCSSCPPADILLQKFAAAEPGADHAVDLIPLGFHVDYWDYLGWKDEMAQPMFTERQKDYARSRSKPMVYTPQMIIQGQDFMVGSDELGIVGAIDSMATASQVDLNETLQADGGRSIAIPGKTWTDHGPLDVYYLRYRINPESVHVRGGENRDQEITYANVVTDLRLMGMLNGADAAAEFTFKIGSDAIPVAEEQELILLQQAGFGPIVGVSRLNL